MAIIAVVSAIAFFARSLTADNPIVDLRAFANRNFALGSLFSFVLGVGLYGLTHLYPLYLAQVRGYNALMIGETMFVSGAAMFLAAPVVGQLTQRFDPRYILIAGFLLFAVGTWQMSFMTADWDFYELLWPQIFRGVGLMAAMIPVTNTALGTLPPDRLKNASGLFNLMRNLGGALGLAYVTTVLNNRTDLHITRLHEAVNPTNVAANETLQKLTELFGGGADASLQALKKISQMAHQQASVMGYADVFWVLTLLFVALAALGFTMRKPQAVDASAAGH